MPIRPVELRTVSDQTLEAVEAELDATGDRDALIARRLRGVPPEFLAQIERHGIWGMAQGQNVLPAGFSRPGTARGRAKVWKQHQLARLARGLRFIAGVLDPD